MLIDPAENSVVVGVQARHLFSCVAGPKGDHRVVSPPREYVDDATALVPTDDRGENVVGHRFR
ncbi:hypothetical protein [Gordonia sp. DT218]|uniref:hypothetical protein n=1 Tax=Gordonia sp. DT218 TaxID=3416659 RepID=UPI003CF9B207